MLPLVLISGKGLIVKVACSGPHHSQQHISEWPLTWETHAIMQDDVIKAAHVEGEDEEGRFTVTEALKDQAVIDLSKVGVCWKKVL